MTERWQLPGYAVEKLIGVGASGEVWRARELATGDLVALKRLRGGRDASAVGRLERLAARLTELSGPHLVRLRSVVPSPDEVVLVLDFAAGGSLADVLALRGRITPGEVVTIVAPLGGAIDEVHAAGLVHGGLRPAAVLFTADGRPLLADLGVANLVSDSGAVLEDIAEYVDPAVAPGLPASPAADVFGLAAIAFAALTGQPPWPVASPREARAATGQLPAIRDLAPHAPPALLDAIASGLAVDPAARPSAAVLAARVRSAGTPAPVGLARPGAPASGVPTPTPVPVPFSPGAVSRGSAPGLPAGADSTPRGDVTTGAHSEDGAAAGGAGPSPVSPSDRGLARLRHRVRLPLALALLVSAAIGLGVVWGRSDAPEARRLPAPVAAPGLASDRVADNPAATAPPTSTPRGATAPSTPSPTVVRAAPQPTAPVSWRLVVTQLGEARCRAFETGDVAALRLAYAPGSAPLAADTAQLRRLVADGQRTSGLRFRVREVVVHSLAADRVTLGLVDELPAYVLVDAQRRHAMPGRAPARFVMALVPAPGEPGQWRIDEVRPA